MREDKSLASQEPLAGDRSRSIRSSFGMRGHDRAWDALLAFDEAMREPSGPPGRLLIEALSHPLAAVGQGVARQGTPDVALLSLSPRDGGLAAQNAQFAVEALRALGFEAGQAQALMSREFMSQTLGVASLTRPPKGGMRADRKPLMDLMGLAGWEGIDHFGSQLSLELALGPLAALDYAEGVAEKFDMGSDSRWEMPSDSASHGVSEGLGLWLWDMLRMVGWWDGEPGDEVDPVLVKRARCLEELARQVAATVASDDAKRVGEALAQASQGFARLERWALGQEAKAAPSRRVGAL